MRYRESPPSPALANEVECYWTLEGFSRDPEVIFPDGRIEMIWHYGDPFERLSADGVEVQSTALLAGVTETAVWLRPCGEAGVFGVKFRPGAAGAFLWFAASEVRGQVLPLDDVLSIAGREVEARMREAADHAARVALVERFLWSRRREVAPPPLFASSRQHRRRFLEAAGTTPKLFARMQRFQAALRHLESAGPADAAVRAGYYDQAHMHRDFHDFAAMTPGQYLRFRGGLEPCPFLPIPAESACRIVNQ